MKRKRQKSSSRKSLRYRGTECLNCGHPLEKSDVFCPNCSQLNSDKQLSVRDFFAEFLSSILVYDSRLRNTLKDLLFKPGLISRNYVKGQRMKYANPFRFFLSVSIIYFLLESFVGLIKNEENIEQYRNNTTATKEVATDSLSNLTPSEVFIWDTPGDSVRAKNLGIPLYYSEKDLSKMPFFDNYGKRGSMYFAYYKKTEIESPYVALDSLDHSITLGNRWLYSRSKTWYKIINHPKAFANYISSKIPFFLFFFTPFYALFFWLIYPSKKFNYVEHVIFIFHIFSFIFLTLVIFRIPELIVGYDFFQGILFLVIGPWYYYRALRTFYEEGRWQTFFKFVLLSIIFFLSFLIATILFLAASAAVY